MCGRAVRVLALDRSRLNCCPVTCPVPVMTGVVPRGSHTRCRYPEWTSDWKMLRFLRGHGTVAKATVAIRDMREYWEGSDMDAVRTRVLAGVEIMVLPPNPRKGIHSHTTYTHTHTHMHTHTHTYV
jgi:hypothetical protein